MDDVENWENDPFGEMAVRLGYCTGKDVRDALNQQQELSSGEDEQKRIGAIMLEDGILTSEQVISILRMLDQQGSGKEAS
jgi:hypothetical protein